MQHNQKLLVIKNAADQENHLQDIYFQQSLAKSALVIPIQYQGGLKRILYIENTSSTHAFTAQQVQSLQLLASQAAISLENAYLYYQATHDGLTGLANRSLLYHLFQ